MLGNAGFLQSIHVHTLGWNAARWSLAYEFWFYALAAGGLLAVAVAGPPVLLLLSVWLIGAARLGSVLALLGASIASARRHLDLHAGPAPVTVFEAPAV